MSALELNLLNKSFEVSPATQKPALQAVSWRFLPSEWISLIGPSASGKTTLLRLIAGLEMPDAGTIRFGTENWTGVPAEKRGVALLSQNPSLLPHLDVEGNIALPLRLRKQSAAGQRTIVAEVVALYNLAPLLRRLPHTLSGGEGQRVSLARAAAQQPRLLLLDEPFAQLDPAARAELGEALQRWQRQTKTPLIQVTHDQQEALAFGHRVAVLAGGTTQQLATPWDLYHAPGNVFVAQFVGEPAMSMLRGEVRDNAFFSGGIEKGIPLPGRLPSGPVLLGLRPEQVALTGEGGHPATLESAVLEGVSWLLRLRLGGNLLHSRVPSRSPAPPSGPVRVRFDLQPLHLFDEHSGERR